MQLLPDVERCADAILARVGKRLVLAAPLAIGKPVALLNALYRRAKADPEIQLDVYTALTLERPKGQSALERRFLGPFVQRVFGDYPDLDFELDRVAGELPPNVRVREFYLYAGKFLGKALAQREYVASHYTHVARDLLERGVNVVVQSVARGTVAGRPMLSLSGNADVTPDVLRGLAHAAYPHVVALQVNDQLPFMYGDALLDEDAADFVVDDPAQYHRLFPTPKTSVSAAEHLIGLHASTLIRDGGSLQIGIGSIGDALVNALLLRQQRNADYLRALDAFGIRQRYGALIERVGGTAPFAAGLFAPTEMLVDGFMHLIEAGVVKRAVYEDVHVQRLLDEGRASEVPSLSLLDALCEAGAIEPRLTPRCLGYLTRIGALVPGIVLDDEGLRLPAGRRVPADLHDADTRSVLLEQGLGAQLSGGAIAHAGFFLGPERFYAWLRGLPPAARARIDMRAVSRVNQLYGQDELARLQRRHARFVNTGMLATLLGAMVSDGLDDGQVVSGVGGQYNFVAMAHALQDARSILQVRATRNSGGELRSNVVYAYGHVTIPRQLRDIVVTEYGIADLRGKTDEEVVQAMLAVADASAHESLRERAVRAHKLSPSWPVPDALGDNRAQVYEGKLAALAPLGLFPAFPFGTELTPQEMELGRALRALKERTSSVQGELAALAGAATHGAAGPDVQELLERMGLGSPEGVEETLHARLLAAELRRQREG